MKATVAETLVGLLANQIADGATVATGVASPMPVLAIAVAKATHAPRLTYLACVGAVDPALDAFHSASEDLRYLNGRVADLSIPDLFDHARRGRIDTIFFGAAEVDPWGNTNLSAAGTLAQPRVKFPGLAGACSLRRWVKRPILLVPKQSPRNLVPRVQVASTRDERATSLFTDLGIFEVGPAGATLLARHPHASIELIRARTGFAFDVSPSREVTSSISAATLEAIRRLDPLCLRDEWVGGKQTKEIVTPMDIEVHRFAQAELR